MPRKIPRKSGHLKSLIDINIESKKLLNVLATMPFFRKKITLVFPYYSHTLRSDVIF